MHYFLILTKECNLRCSYCGGGSDTPPKEINYSISDLKSFLSKDPTAVLEFYGGEPLLRTEVLKKIIDEIPARFVLQTNAIFLDRIEPKYLKKFHSILASIDGTREVTDTARGRGVSDRVISNVANARKHGFRGDLIARMTVREGTDIFENVNYLLKSGLFDHVHWQLDFAMFWKSGVDDHAPIDWINEYNSGITRLVEEWVGEMSETGRVEGLVPFVGITNSLLSGKPAVLRCGSGIDCFTVMPDGRISACPVSIDYDFSILGSIFENAPSSLCNVARIGEPCLSCEVFGLCGGRCLLVNKSQEMLRPGGFGSICSTVKHLTGKLQQYLPQVQAMIEDQTIKRSDFNFPELNNGCEIIP